MAFNLSAVLTFATKGLEPSLDKAKKSLQSFNSNLQKAKQNAVNMGKGALTLAAGGTAVAAGIGYAVKSFSDFQRQMDSVTAKMIDGQENYQALSELAKEMGSTTIFTAKQSAQGLEYLALAGFNAKDAMGVLPTILKTAGAGALELGRASDIVTDSMSAMAPIMKGYGDRTKQAIALADTMALAQARTNTNIEQLGEAIKFGGGALANMGVPLNEIIGSMGALADAGLKGSIGGTSLLNMMNKLAKPSSGAKKIMDELGISMEMLKTPEGKLRSMTDIIEVFNKAMSKNPDVLTKAGNASEIFGLRGQRAFFALANKGTKDLNKLFNQLEKSQGSAEKQYQIMTDNLYGSTEALKSAIQGTVLNFGEMFSKMFDLKGVIQAITTPISNMALAFSAAMKSSKDWNVAQQQLMKTPIGQFALGIVEGFQEVKLTIKELLIEGKKLLGFGKDSGVNFKDLGKTVIKFAAALALIGPPVLAIGASFLFLTPIIMGVSSAFGLLGNVMGMVMSVGKLLGMGVIKLGSLIGNLGIITKATTFIKWQFNVALKALAFAGNAFLSVMKFMATALRLDVLVTKAAMIAKAAFNTVMTTMSTVVSLVSARIGAMTIVQKAAAMWTKIVTAAQWLWNAALSANPIGLVVIGIGALIAAGIALYKYWDEVKELFIKVWDWLGNWKIAIAALMGPIGWLAGAGVAIYKNWDKVTEVLGRVWGWVKKLTSGALDKLKGVASFFGIGGEEPKQKEIKTADTVKQATDNVIDFQKVLDAQDKPLPQMMSVGKPAEILPFRKQEAKPIPVKQIVAPPAPSQELKIEKPKVDTTATKRMTTADVMRAFQTADKGKIEALNSRMQADHQRKLQRMGLVKPETTGGEGAQKEALALKEVEAENTGTMSAEQIKQLQQSMNNQPVQSGGGNITNDIKVVVDGEVVKRVVDKRNRMEMNKSGQQLNASSFEKQTQPRYGS